jgi:hypothetical protein
MALTPCTRCARHHRTDEAACPFCHATTHRLSRPAGLGVLLASSLLFSACVVATPTPVYGAPAPPYSPSPKLPGEPSPSPSPDQ